MSTLERFAAVHELNTREAIAVRDVCRVVGVSRSGYYKWLRRKNAPAPRVREVSDAELTEAITKIWRRSRGSYGSRRVTRQLRRDGIVANRKRVARLMRRAGLSGRCGRRKVRTTIPDAQAQPAADRVKRNFDPESPDQVWAGDITYVPVGTDDWLYVATVIDLYSRRVIGWAMAEHMRTDLVCDALTMALERRGGTVRDVIFHSDRGSQYTAEAYETLCAEAGVTRSMGAVGVCWDNAAAEAFFATLKKECVHLHQFESHEQAKQIIFQYIEGWYNTERLHSTLDYLTPQEKEHYYWTNQNAA